MFREKHADVLKKHWEILGENILYILMKKIQ